MFKKIILNLSIMSEYDKFVNTKNTVNWKPHFLFQNAWAK